ncbi:MAG: CvpA family protein [Planctomycetaceae bacterium]|nr:CvpA family protein [Planctomycetaceae bacterium]
MSLTIFVLVILAICVSMTLTEGLWGNTLSLFNVVFSAILATNYFEPVANWLTEQFSSFTYVWDFLALWGVFVLSMVILRTTTDQISDTKVRFKLPLEQGGKILCGFLIGWVMVSLFLFSLHVAPLKRNPFGGAFAKSPTSSNFFLSPDMLWLGFMQSRSENAFATSPANPFDPQSEFVLKYGQRRHDFSKLPKLRVAPARRQYASR